MTGKKYAHMFYGTKQLNSLINKEIIILGYEKMKSGIFVIGKLETEARLNKKFIDEIFKPYYILLNNLEWDYNTFYVQTSNGHLSKIKPTKNEIENLIKSLEL